jgi:hypothetical protein
VKVRIERGNLVITPSSAARRGWDEAFKGIAEREDESATRVAVRFGGKSGAVASFRSALSILRASCASPAASRCDGSTAVFWSRCSPGIDVRDSAQVWLEEGAIKPRRRGA